MTRRAGKGDISDFPETTHPRIQSTSREDIKG